MADIYSFDKNQNAASSKKLKKQQFIENLREGDVVTDFFAVKLKHPPRPYKRGNWFGIVVLDKTGEIAVKYWGGENKESVKRLYDSFKVGDVVKIRMGNVEIYEDKPQISINETVGGLRRLNANEYDIVDFIPSLEERTIDEYLIQIKKDIKSVENDQLRSLLKLFFDDPDFEKIFCHSPSAITHHHNYVGGNLEHTIGVLRLCKNICEMYPSINRDLVLTGAILHDVGKIMEYSTTAAIDKTDQGNFIGHIVIGDRMLREKISKLRKKGVDFSQGLEDKICHIILSHHGKYEYGSPRMPKTIEAMVVHSADLMDSQVKNFIQTIEEGRKTSDDDWGFIWDSDAGQKRPMYLGEN